MDICIKKRMLCPKVRANLAKNRKIFYIKKNLCPLEGKLEKSLLEDTSFFIYVQLERFSYDWQALFGQRAEIIFDIEKGLS